MGRLTLIVLALGGTSALSSAAELPAVAENTAQQAMLDALDPTRIALATCGPRSPARTLNERLRLAAEYAEAGAPGSDGMHLLAGIAASQIPASGLDLPARRYFDQGIALAYGFNHGAAIQSFREARKLAPDCAMCWWGEALANGPNINAGMDSEQNRAALAALEQARRLAASASPLEQALIAAQSLRYSMAANGDRAALDTAYADAMLQLAAAHPANDDVAVLAAEAAMNTTPWNYWDAETQAAPNLRIGEAVALIERVIARNPRHPQATHLYIHLMENNADPRRAEAAADQLAVSAPATLGHLVHMPAHIYHRIGRYRDSIDANIAAARADEEYLASSGGDPIYRFGYYPHNVHFLLTSAQMVGQMGIVASETERLKRIIDVETARQLPWVQAVHAAPAFALAQFASPAAILALTAQPSELTYVEAMRRYARAVAHAQTGESAAFDTDIAALDALAKSGEAAAMLDAGFPAPDLIRLAIFVAKGKRATLAGDYAVAVEQFEQAEAIERAIPYTEPAYWYYPVAQSRGAALYLAGRYLEARAAFTKALVETPNNGWVLYGLAQTHRKLGHRLEAQASQRAFERVWQGENAWLRMTRL